MARLSRLGAVVGFLVAAPGTAQPSIAQIAADPAPRVSVDPRPRSLTTPAPSPSADRIARWHSYIAEAADRFGLPARWITRVMRVESGGATRLDGAPITSPAGAMGLMQLMPGTWAAMRAAYGLGTDPYDPHDNIIAGTAYLRALYDRFGYPGLFGAYNAGPGRYGAYLAGVRALPQETRRYLATVTASSLPTTPATATLPGDRLFAARALAGEASLFVGSAGCVSVLFAIRRDRSCAP